MGVWGSPRVLLRGSHCGCRVGLELGVSQPVCAAPRGSGRVCPALTSQLVLEVQLWEF